jgi:hypothetical protein
LPNAVDQIVLDVLGGGASAPVGTNSPLEEIDAGPVKQAGPDERTRRNRELGRAPAGCQTTNDAESELVDVSDLILEGLLLLLDFRRDAERGMRLQPFLIGQVGYAVTVHQQDAGWIGGHRDTAQTQIAEHQTPAAAGPVNDLDGVGEAGRQRQSDQAFVGRRAALVIAVRPGLIRGSRE